MDNYYLEEFTILIFSVSKGEEVHTLWLAPRNTFTGFSAKSLYRREWMIG